MLHYCCTSKRCAKMTNSALKLPFAGQSEMAGSTTFLASQAFLDPHIPLMLSACSFIGKLLNTDFHGKQPPVY